MARRTPLLRLLLLHHHPLRPAPPPPFLRPFSTSSSPKSISDVARTVSTALLNYSADDDTSTPTSADAYFSLHLPHVRFTTALLTDVLRLSAPAGRNSLSLFRWLVDHRSFKPTDESLSQLVAFFGRKHDFKSIHAVLVEFRSSTGQKTFYTAVDRLVRAGRAPEAVQFFEKMETEYGFKQDRFSLSVVVKLLADHGYGGHAEKCVNRWAGKIFPDQEMCYDLIRGWCVDAKPDEAIRLMEEMIRGGYEIGTPAYNSILDSVCRLCRKKDPLRMPAEAEKVLVEMEAKGVPRDTETFSVLITNFCKIRKTEDAMKLFGRMSEWGCSPDAGIYLALIRSLYQAARVSEGDTMVNRMWAAGFKAELDVKECYGFLNILCGIERVDHAMKVFKMLKSKGFRPGVQTYELLTQKLAAHNQVDRANALFQRAVRQGIPLTPKTYAVDPKYVVKTKREVEKMKGKKKRLTLPQKMTLKRKRLRKLKLSFVKKPRKMRAY